MESFSPLKSELHNLPLWNPNHKWCDKLIALKEGKFYTKKLSTLDEVPSTYDQNKNDNSTTLLSEFPSNSSEASACSPASERKQI